MQKDNIIDFYKRYPVIVICGVLSVLIAMFIFLRTDPIPGYKKQLVDLERQLKAINYNKTEGISLPEDVVRIEKVAEDINKRLMDSNATTQNLSYFFELESLSNTMIGDPVQLAPKKLQDKQVAEAYRNKFAIDPVWIDYEMDIQGSFSAVLMYLESLVSSQYFVRIKAFNMKPMQDGETVVLNTSFVVLGKEK